MSCCPENSVPYLDAVDVESGSVVTIDGYSYYKTNEKSDNKLGVLIIPDIFGWNGGRTRFIADIFAKNGYMAVIPKFLDPPLDGGTDGDGLPSNFDFATRRPEFGPYITTFPYAVLSPKIKGGIKLLKEAGVEKIGIIGFCWGGWLLTHFFSDPELPEEVKAGAIPHPSITTIEDNLFKGDSVSLSSKIQRPILLLPAGNDPDSYRLEGDVYLAMKVSDSFMT